jgi:hypothetical protein
MADFEIRELNTARILQWDLTRGGVALDLSAADHVSLTLNRMSDGNLLADHEAMTIGENGRVSYHFASLPAGSSGSYRVQIEVWWDALESEDVPCSTVIKISDHLGTHG